MTASAIIILQKSTRIAELLEERIGVKGPTLEARVHRARRVLPRDARSAARRIVQAERQARTGSLRDLDAHRFDDDYRVVLRHVQGLDRRSLTRSLWRAVVQGGLTALCAGVMLGVGLSLSGLV